MLLGASSYGACFCLLVDLWYYFRSVFVMSNVVIDISCWMLFFMPPPLL